MARNEIAIILTAVDQASRVLAEARGSIEALDRQSAQAGRQGLASLDASFASLTRAGSLLTSTVTPAVVSLGAAGVAAYRQLEQATSLIARSTGATGQQLVSLRRDFDAVFRQVPESARDVAVAVGEINTRLGLTGERLQGVSRQFLDFARVNNAEVGAAVSEVSRLVNALGLEAERVPELLDKLTFAAQQTGISAVDLARNITEAGPAFEELGFDVDRTIALFAEFERAGARPQEVIGSLNIVLTRLARSGATDAREAFDQLLASIRDAPSLLQAVDIAADAFGSRVGAKVAEDIRAGRFEVDAFVEALQDTHGTLHSTAEASLTMGERLAQSRNELTLAIGRLVETSGAADALTSAITSLSNAISAASDWLSSLSDGQRQAVLATVALSGALGPLLIVLGQLPDLLRAAQTGVVALRVALAALTGPVGVVALVVTALIGAGGLALALSSTTSAADEARDALAAGDRDSLLTALGKVADEAAGPTRDALIELQHELVHTGDIGVEQAQRITAALSAATNQRLQQLYRERERLEAQLAAPLTADRSVYDPQFEVDRLNELAVRLNQEIRFVFDETTNRIRAAEGGLVTNLELLDQVVAANERLQRDTAQITGQASTELAAVRADIAELEAEIAALEQSLGSVRDPGTRTQPNAPRPDPPVPDPERTRQEAEEVVGLIARAEAELAEARRQWRAAETEEDVIFWARRIEEAEKALSRLRRLHEDDEDLLTQAIRRHSGRQAPVGGAPAALGTPWAEDAARIRHDTALARRRIELAERLAQNVADAERRKKEASDAARIALDTEIAMRQAAVAAARELMAQNAALQEQARAIAADTAQAQSEALEKERRDRVEYYRELMAQNAALQEQARAIAADTAQAMADAAAAAAQVEVGLAVEPLIELTNANTSATLALVNAKHLLGRASKEDLQVALAAEAQTLEILLDTVTEGSSEWYEYARALVRVRGDLERLEGAQQQANSTIADYAQVARAASDALGLGLSTAISAVESLTANIIRGDIFGAVASGFNLLSALIGDISNGIAEVNRQIEQLANRSRYLSEQLVRELAVTRRERRGGLLGWLGFTREVLDEDATRAALAVGEDIAAAIARGIRDGAEALERAINDILLQAAIESVILDEATQALIRAWVEAFQAGDKAAMERVRGEFMRVVEDARRWMIDAGLIELPEPTPTPRPTPRTGGVQISEITGPTRDLFADLMSPLIELPVQTMLLRDIRDLMALPGPMSVPALATPSIGTMNITIQGYDPFEIGRHVIELFERQFAIQRRGIGR